MQVATLTIEGMRCEGCAERIRALLEREPGVREAAVPFVAGGDAWVRYDPEVIRRERLIAVVEAAGFRIVKGA